MQTCAFCESTLHPRAEWKGSGGLFYCNEFCADTEVNFAPAMSRLWECLDLRAAHERR
jgi:hypothetical protein